MGSSRGGGWQRGRIGQHGKPCYFRHDEAMKGTVYASGLGKAATSCGIVSVHRRARYNLSACHTVPQVTLFSGEGSGIDCQW